MSNANNDTDPPEAKPGAFFFVCVCVGVLLCVCGCGCVCGGAGVRWGPAWASGSRQESRFPTATAIYLCLGPPGRSDTNGITPTGRQGAEKENKKGSEIEGE